ncbi:hypothetical protein [Clostridium perfringens]|nr:hypothetical protein [Clostridium perfringens]MDM0651630.1 hypothetical protein [Clostridium perfringens]
MFSLLLISCSNQDTVTVNLPFNTDYNKANVNVEYTKYLPNFLITKYYVKYPENISIDNNNLVYLSTSPNKYDGFGLGTFTVLSKKISSNKLEVIDRFILPENVPSNSINIQYSISQNTLPTKTFNLNTPLSLNNDNYVSLNKKIKIDNIDINLVSLYYFEYGCILDFYTENINDLSSYNIDKTFEIKLTSPNFTNNYDIKSLFALKNDYLKNLSRNKNFNPKSKYTEFLSCNVNYDINTIKQFNLYLVNKQTGTEYLIYSN